MNLVDKSVKYDHNKIDVESVSMRTQEMRATLIIRPMLVFAFDESRRLASVGIGCCLARTDSFAIKLQVWRYVGDMQLSHSQDEVISKDDIISPAAARCNLCTCSRSNLRYVHHAKSMEVLHCSVDSNHEYLSLPESLPRFMEWFREYICPAQTKQIKEM